jgi:hypothetical protein
MTLSLSLSLLPKPPERLLTTGPLAAEGWVLVPSAQGGFDIQSARVNSMPPPLRVIDGAHLGIGTPSTGWELAPVLPAQLRILQAVSNSPAPALSVTGSTLILIGA